MKTTLIGLFITTLLILMAFDCKTESEEPKYIINEKEVNLSFTTKFMFSDLVKVKNELKAFGIELIYTSLQFTKDGYLKQISASIKYADGSKASFTSRELMPEDGPGFKRKFKE